MRYSAEIERQMKTFYHSLSEKDRRRYAAVEAFKLGHGGIRSIASLLECDPQTIAQGRKDLESPPDLPPERLRQPGGGRKKALESIPDLEANFLCVVKDRTAGDPMTPDVRWTNLTLREIADGLAELGTPVSVRVVKQLLKKHKYTKRKAQKSQSMGEHRDRNAQFENIERLKKEYLESDNPILSMDTKKKELLGNFYRAGELYTQEVIAAFDHDFPSAAEGVIIPHGLYDCKQNVGHLLLGTSHDTSEFACESLAHWWWEYGKASYPEATSIFVLCDGGGSNSASQYLFKEDLQKLVDQLGIEIRVAHYPPYTSKYNPIEHRLFCHVSRACQGVVFHTKEIVKHLMEKTKTSTGLSVTVEILDKIYQTGRHYAEGFKENMKIMFDEILPKWNYRAIPAQPTAL